MPLISGFWVTSSNPWDTKTRSWPAAAAQMRARISGPGTVLASANNSHGHEACFAPMLRALPRGTGPYREAPGPPTCRENAVRRNWPHRLGNRSRPRSSGRGPDACLPPRQRLSQVANTGLASNDDGYVGWIHRRSLCCHRSRVFARVESKGHATTEHRAVASSKVTRRGYSSLVAPKGSGHISVDQDVA